MNTEVKINPIPTEEKKSASGNRITILLVILVIMICALAYDRFLARPSSKKGFKIVQDLVQKNVAASVAEKSITNLAVRKALGKEPAESKTTQDYTIETYRWSRGLVGLTYSVHVVYKPNDNGQLVVYAPYQNQQPPASNLPGYVPPNENITNPIVTPGAEVKSEPAAGEKKTQNEPVTEPTRPETNPNATAQ